MADARAGEERGAEVPSRPAEVDVDGLRVPLWQVSDLSDFVDVAALLGDAEPPEPPYWMHLWPGARALARIVAACALVGPGVQVLELGCGLALPALVAARRGASVVASDREAGALALAGHSATANGCRLHRVRMDWRAPALGRRFDLCLGADVGYDAGAERGLATALGRLTKRGGVVWLADSVNTARTTLAAALEAAGFAVAVSQVREGEEGRPVWVRLIEARQR